MNFIQSTMSGKKAEKILLLILIARRYEIHSEKFKCLSLVRCWCVRVQRQWCVCVGVSVVIVIRALAGENIDVDIIASSFQLFSLSIPFEYLFVGVFIFSFRIVFSSFHFFRSRKNMSSICQFIKFDAAKSEKKKEAKKRNGKEKNVMRGNGKRRSMFQLISIERNKMFTKSEALKMRLLMPQIK